jgi:putative chitinase
MPQRQATGGLQNMLQPPQQQPLLPQRQPLMAPRRQTAVPLLGTQGQDNLSPRIGGDDILTAARGIQSVLPDELKEQVTLPVANVGGQEMTKPTMQSVAALARKNGITEGRELEHFMAQLAHESGGFKHLTELGGRKYFDRYEGRKDLGNTQSGDGYKYRGRGFIQLTGRANYTEMSKKLGVDLVNNPELASTPEIATQIAAEFWRSRGLDKLAQEDNIRGITKRINGGYNGLADRKRWLSKIRQMNSI